MASLDMSGPLKLSVAEIDRQVTRTEPGNYGLGSINDKGGFTVYYIGRADNDLNKRLKDHAATGKYPDFKYSYASSPKAAFEKECKNFHDFGGVAKLDNKIHPDRPKDTGWKCPYCNTFD